MTDGYGTVSAEAWLMARLHRLEDRVLLLEVNLGRSSPHDPVVAPTADQVADKARELFFSILPQDQIKWSALSYRAKCELLDAVHDTVKAAYKIIAEGDSK